MTPRGLAARVRKSDAPRVVSTSIPKAGTHLLERTLCLHPDLHRKLHRKVFDDNPANMGQLLKRTVPGQVICGHVIYSEEMAQTIAANDAISLFIVRDPRDIVVSHAHYIKNFEGHEWNHLVAERPDLDSRIRLFIEGDEEAGIESIGEVLNGFSGWLEHADVTVRYEDLVAPETREDTASELFDRLGVPLDQSALRRITDRTVSPVSVTFRKGRSGEGRRSFNPELEELYTQVAGPFLERYGYDLEASTRA